MVNDPSLHTQYELANQLITRYNDAKQQRDMWNNHWADIRKYVFPTYQDFRYLEGDTQSTQSQQIFDSTAPLALERFAAALDGMLTPRMQPWHSLKVTDPDLNEHLDVKAWLQQLVEALFTYRYHPSAHFSSQQHEVYLSLGAFGTGVLFVDQGKGGIRYQAIPIHQIYLSQSHHGHIDTVYRYIPLTAKQVLQQWPDVKSKRVKELAQKRPDHRVECLHIVLPNSHISDASRLHHLNMPYQSYYVLVQDKEILNQGGYQSFPYIISRYITENSHVYGRSPAMTVLADIKMLNEMEKTQLRAVHQQVLPPLLVPDDGVVRAITLTPGAINYGGIDMHGRSVIQPLQTAGQLSFGEAKMEQKRQLINEAFMVNIFQAFSDQSKMTATEVMSRMEEKSTFLSPLLARQQSESLGPLIERELDLLIQQDLVPPMPDILALNQADFEISYDSPMARLQKVEQIQSVLRTIDVLKPFIDLDPSLMGLFDPMKLATMVARINGVPNHILRSPEEVLQMQQDEQLASTVDEAIAQAPAVVSTLNELSHIEEGVSYA